MIKKLGPVFLVALGIYYAYTTYYPIYTKWETEIQELQKNIAQAQQIAPKVALLMKQQNELKEKLRASLTKLPSGAELGNLLNLVMPILNDVGIRSTRIATKSVDLPVMHDVYRSHALAVGGITEVPIETIVKLLFKLRNFNRIVNVKSISMIRTAPTKATYTIDLHLETYSYIEMVGDDLGMGASSSDTAEVAISTEEIPSADVPGNLPAPTDTTSASAPSGTSETVATVATVATVPPAVASSAADSAAARRAMRNAVRDSIAATLAAHTDSIANAVADSVAAEGAAAEAPASEGGE